MGRYFKVKRSSLGPLFMVIGCQRLLPFLVFLIGWNMPLKAQETPPIAAKPDAHQPFQTIRMGAMGTLPVATRNLSAWTASMGPSISLTTPFFVGEVGLAFSYLTWETTEQTTPDFSSTLIMADWSVFSSPENHVKLGAGVRFGNFFMAFDNNQLSGERNESEIIISPFVQIRRTLFRDLEVFGELNISRVFTQPYVDLVQASAGFAYSISAPSWLKEVLQ